MTDRELMQMVLDALEYLPEMRGIEEAIQALRDRLAQPESQTKGEEHMTDLRKAAEMALEALEELRFANAPFLDEAMEALRTALAQPEQECIYPECETGIGCDGPCGEKPIDETAKRGHEPVAWLIQYQDRHEFVFGKKPEFLSATFLGATVLAAEPLYTAPPKREWVGLTDEERKDIELGVEVFDMSVEDILKEAEAKLKEKNS